MSDITSQYTHVLPASQVEQFIAEKRKFKIDTGKVMSKAFDFAKENIGPTLIMGVMFQFASIIAYWLYGGAFMSMYDEKVKGQKFEVSSIFKGFDFGKEILMFLLYYVLIAFALMIIPAVTIGLFVGFSAGAESLGMGGGEDLVAILVFLIYGFMLLAMILLSTFFVFAVHFIIFSGMDAMKAIKSSASIVKNNFFTVFIFSLACGLVTFLGIMVCFVGVLFTMPMVVYATHYAFEEIFPLEGSEEHQTDHILDHLV